jgi:chromate reductase
MISNAQNAFDQNGRLIDESTREHIRGLLKALHDWTLMLKR